MDDTDKTDNTTTQLHWLRDYAVYTDYTDYTAKITLLLTTVNYSDLLTKSTTPTSLNTSISLTTL